MKEKVCSVCGKKAIKEIQIIWKGKEGYCARCGNHIVKDYQGIIREIK
jgi:hypothetical protein